MVSIDPNKALDRESIAQQERYRIAKSSHVAVWLERGGLSQMGVQTLDGYCNRAARADKYVFACNEHIIVYSERLLLLQHVRSKVSG